MIIGWEKYTRKENSVMVDATPRLHHQILSLIITWFLIRETRRGKKDTPGLTNYIYKKRGDYDHARKVLDKLDTFMMIDVHLPVTLAKKNHKRFYRTRKFSVNINMQWHTTCLYI